MGTIAWFATKGSGTNEAKRMETLLRHVGATELPFDKANKKQSLIELWKRVRQNPPELLVMEGTGIAGGLICLAARVLLKVPYVVSSGDAVGPFIRAHNRVAGVFFEIYERVLCRLSAGFIGWTPYLCGRAMTFGAPRAVTAPGWVIGGMAHSERAAMREALGIPADKLVVGLLGALEWNSQREWCYGADLVRVMQKVNRPDLCVLVVGGGSGLAHLQKEAGEALGKRIFLPGPVPLERVMPTLAAMDAASLPQSVDGVGMFRYTTKLPEYAGAGLPVITNRVPMAYDLGDGWMWRLPGDPWGADYLDELAKLLNALTPAMVEEKRTKIPDLKTLFDGEAQVRRVTAFIQDIVAEKKS